MLQWPASGDTRRRPADLAICHGSSLTTGYSQLLECLSPSCARDHYLDAGAIKVIRGYDDPVVSRVSGLTRLDADVGHSTIWQHDTGGGVAGKDFPGVLINADRGVAVLGTVIEIHPLGKH